MAIAIRQYPHSNSAALDIISYDDRAEVQIELPGVAPQDVQIEFDAGVLTINAERPAQNARYTRRERHHGVVRRVLQVPDTFDAHNAAAEFENGVLILTLPKKAEAQPVRIAVNTVHA